MCSVQVWFSSSWTHSAHNSFRKALTIVLEKEFQAGASPEVLVILSYWQVNYCICGHKMNFCNCNQLQS
jgi:hypothetical protein